MAIMLDKVINTAKTKVMSGQKFKPTKLGLESDAELAAVAISLARETQATLPIPDQAWLFNLGLGIWDMFALVCACR